MLGHPRILAEAEAIIGAAAATLAGLADEGWSSVLGSAIGGRGLERLGADAVVDRTESFDVLAG